MARIYGQKEISTLLVVQSFINGKTWYMDECNRQLTDTKFYQRLDEDITAEIQKRVTFYVNRMHKDKLINDKTKQYLIQSDVKPGRFYILPKIHKPGNPGRPIVSSNSHPTERLSHFVDYHLQPLVHKLPSFVKDTNDFLNKLLSVIYPLILYLLHLMFHHYILISHIRKVLMLVSISYALPPTKSFPLAHSAISST